jgi:hypothetical protein
MSRRVLVLVLALTVLVAIDIVLAMRTRTNEKEERATPGGPLVTFRPDDVTRIAVSRKDRSVVVERGEGGAWGVASSRGFPARAGRAEALLFRVLSWRRDRVAGAAGRAQAYRLDEASIEIDLRARDGRLIAHLFLGGLTGVDPEASRRGGSLDERQLGRFVRVAGESEVYILPELVASELEPNERDWLESPLVAGDPSLLARLELRRRDGLGAEIIFEGEGAATSGGWPLEPSRVQALGRAIFELAAASVGAEAELPRAGLTPPLLEAKCALRDGRTTTLAIGDGVARVSSDVYAAVDGLPRPLRVPRHLAEPLLDFDLERALVRRPFGELEPARVRWIVLVEPGREIAVEHGGARRVEWLSPSRRGARAARPGDAELVLPRVLGLELSRFGPVPEGALQGAAKIALVLEGGERRELFVGSPAEGGRAARRSDVKLVGRVDAGAFDDVREAIARLVDD